MAGKPGMKQNQFSLATKLEAVKLHLEDGLTVREVMDRFGVAAQGTVRAWCAAYRKSGASSESCASSASSRWLADTVRDALKKEKVAGGLQLHSDQGFQYTSHAYFRLVQEYGVTPSMSRRGNCLDNASMENFFGMLKTEWLQRRKFATFDEAKTAVEQYIRYYNYERCRLKTKRTPYQVRCQSA